MSNIIKISRTDGNWKIGTIDGVPFEAKVYEEPSEFGIQNGNVSKLFIKDVCSYDRGWDKKPALPKEKAMVKALLDFFKKPENC